MVQKLISWWRDLDAFTRYTFLIILTGIILRFYLALISVSLSGVETWHLNAAKYVASVGNIPAFVPFIKVTFEYTPLYHIIGAILYSFFGLFSRAAGEIALKMVTPLFGSMSLVLVYLIAKKMFKNPRISLYATAFLTFLPIHIYTSVYPVLDGEVAFFIFLGVYCLLYHRILLAAIALAMGFYSKLYGLIYFPVFLFLIYKNNKKKSKVFLKKALIFSVVLLLLISPWFVRNYIHYDNPTFPLFNNFFGGYEQNLVGVRLNPYLEEDKNFALKMFTGTFGFIEEDKNIQIGLTGITKETVKSMVHTDSPLVVGFFNFYFLAMVMFFLPLFYGLYFFFKKRDKYFGSLLIWFFCGILWQLIFIFAVNNNSVSRYLAAAAPPLAIWWAFGFDKFSKLKFLRKKKQLIKLVSLFAFGFLIFIAAFESYKVYYIADRFHEHDGALGWVNRNVGEHQYFYNTTELFLYYVNGYHTSSLDELFEKGGYIAIQGEDHAGSPLFLPSSLPEGIEERVTLVYANEKSDFSLYKAIS